MIQTNQVQSSNNYELKIISQDEVSKGKILKQYDLNGEKVIGVYENENFCIQFKNNTWNKVQVKISIDGTDVITGKLADTSVTSDMWVCQPYGTLELKAFPETNKGGAEFIFGKTKDSVAVNTHGVKTGIGYIAAAVFIEEVQNNPVRFDNWRGKELQNIQIPTVKPVWIHNGLGDYGSFCGSNLRGASGTVSSLNVKSINNVTMDSINCDQSIFTAQSANFSDVTMSAPAVGAGEYVAQEIIKVAGLNNPVFATCLTIKYEWWVSLRSKIRALKEKPINPAFPGDQNVIKMIDLKSTPRKKKNKKVNNEVKYPELNRFG